MAERWYSRHSDTFRHAFDRKELVFYADQPDFEQTNVISEQLEEGTGGVTESNRTRVIMPFTGIYADNDHVLGHELVHVFQYNIAEGTPGGGLMRLDALPLWLIEGMAEYFSLGRDDPLTAMWMRDAVMRNKFPTIKQLTTDPRFFPYRYGQALWAYVGGRWGDRSIVEVYRTALRLGWDAALVRVLGENQDSLSKDWAAANRAMYLPQIAGRTHPDSIGHQARRPGAQRRLQRRADDQPGRQAVRLLLERENLFTIDLFVGDATTGRIIKKLAGPSSDPHFDAISFINSAGDWSPDAGKFAFIVYAEGSNEIAILDTKSTSIERRIKLPGIGAVSHISWSPDGRHAGVLRHGRRNQRSVLAGLECRNDQAAHERQVRRHPADLVARRQDHRLRHRPRSADRLQHPQVLAAPAGDVRRRDGPHQRLLAVRPRATTSTRSSRPTARTCSSSPTRTASPTSTA